MDPNQSAPTNPLPTNEPVGPTQNSSPIEFPSITPAATAEPLPNPTNVTSSPTTAEPTTPANSLTNNSMSEPSPMLNSPFVVQDSRTLDPIAVEPLPPSSSLSKIKLPFPAIIIGLIILVILIVVLSLTITNSVKPTTQTINNGSTSQPPP